MEFDNTQCDFTQSCTCAIFMKHLCWKFGNSFRQVLNPFWGQEKSSFRYCFKLRMLPEKAFQLIVYRLKKSPVLVKQREGGKWNGRDNLLCTRQFAIPRQNCMALLNIKDPFLTVMDNESSNTHVGNCILHFQLFVPRWGPSIIDVL